MNMLFVNHAVLPHFYREPPRFQHEIKLFPFYGVVTTTDRWDKLEAKLP
ncbi:MAG: hypothetical protein JO251_08225 [Verrucomicrobia bacterium]|nr:hypothetical protein [Verrucomicrobiota bacterium]